MEVLSVFTHYARLTSFMSFHRNHNRAKIDKYTLREGGREVGGDRMIGRGGGRREGEGGGDRMTRRG